MSYEIEKRLNRYNNGANYYNATQDREVQGDIVAYNPALPTPIIQIDGALQAQGGARETATPLHHAGATAIRLGLLMVVLGILAVALAYMGLGALWGLLVFAGLCVLGYWLLLKLELSHSVNGLERHRIDRATELAKLSLKYQQQLRRDALNAALKHFEKGGK